MNATRANPIYCALDTADQDRARTLANQIASSVGGIKLGLEFVTGQGMKSVNEFVAGPLPVFLDLKFHDIPNTCAKAVGAAAELGVWMVNVHASGGRRMMEAAREEVEKKSHQPLLIAVTVLTSMEREDLADIGLDIDPVVQVERLAKLTERCGFHGVVCSAQEVGLIRSACSPQFLTVTPGIRPAGSDAGDQRRIMTPPQAQEAGVSYMVIGRPITQAADPAAACHDILTSLR